jgi:hypothetical protein
MRVAVDMIAKFPSLEDLGWTLYDNEKRYPKIRVANRHGFAFVFSDCTFPSLETADITFDHEAPLNQNMKPADLLNNHSYDPLSTALRRTFSQCPNLTHLSLTGVFDSSLFWPSSQQPLSMPAPNCWPNLQSVIVTFDPTTPSGRWYFTGPSGNDPEQDVTSLPTADDNNDDDSDPDSEDSPRSDDDDDAWDPFDVEEHDRLIGIKPIRVFRSVPNPTHLNPLILAFANFVENITSPFLRIAALTTGPFTSSGIGHIQFDICYYAPNQKAYYGDEGVEDKRYPRLYLEVGEWVPDPEMFRRLKEAGRRKWGVEELLVRFLKTQY